ncbi:hypothetical protein CN234_35330, partial [Sinorhizobium meliloti]
MPRCGEVRPDPSPTPPHKGEGRLLQHSLGQRTSFASTSSLQNGRAIGPGRLAPPTCGEGLGRGLMR